MSIISSLVDTITGKRAGGHVDSATESLGKMVSGIAGAVSAGAAAVYKPISQALAASVRAAEAPVRTMLAAAGPQGRDPGVNLVREIGGAPLPKNAPTVVVATGQGASAGRTA